MPSGLRFSTHHPTTSDVATVAVNLSLIDEVNSNEVVAAIEDVLFDLLLQEVCLVEVHTQL